MEWHSPQEWLFWKLEQVLNLAPDRTTLWLKPLLESIDGDTIQDIYDEQMESDGYFEATE